MSLTAGSILTFDYSGAVKLYTLPPGKYKLEVWGARGGYGRNTTNRGGYGGYSAGIISLEEETPLYVVVGGQGGDCTTATANKNAGGYNGGGDTYGTTSKYLGSGGGATHIALQDGLLSSLSNAKDSILLVAGGGGGGGYESSSFNSTGGHGGGTSGTNGTTNNSSYQVGGAGTQTAGGSSGVATGSFGQGGNATSDAIGGGGGYYGGGVGKYTSGGGGGSGYINSSLLTDATTIAGNISMPTHDGTGTMTGNNAAGYAKITVIELYSDTAGINGYVKTNNNWLPSTGMRIKSPYTWEKVLGFYIKNDGIWQLLHCNPEKPDSVFNNVMDMLGLERVYSLNEMLYSDIICNKIASNEEACTLMADNYRTEMSTAIDINFTDSLNILNYKCRAKTYLFRNGNQCKDITGGWTADNGVIENTQIKIYGYWDQNKANSYDGYGGEAGGAYTVNKLDLTGYSKYGCSMSVNCSSYISAYIAMGGSLYNGNSYWYADGYCQNTIATANGDLATATYYATETMGTDKYASVRVGDPSEVNGYIYAATAYFYNIWVEPDNTTPFNKALTLVGLDNVDSINSVLSNSTMCETLAANDEAVTMMADNYSTEITQYVTDDLTFSDGLNLLAYKTGKCRFYAYRVVGSTYYRCHNIVGNWSGYNIDDMAALTYDNATYYRGIFVGKNGENGESEDFRCYTANAIVDKSKYTSVSFNTIWQNAGDGELSRGGIVTSVPTSSYEYATQLQDYGIHTATWDNEDGIDYISMGYYGTAGRFIIDKIWVDP